MNLTLAFLTASEWAYTLVIVAYLVTVLSIIAVVISENRNPVKSLAWVTAMLSCRWWEWCSTLSSGET